MKGYKDCELCEGTGEITYATKIMDDTVMLTSIVDCPVCLKRRYKKRIKELKAVNTIGETYIKGEYAKIVNVLLDDFSDKMIKGESFINMAIRLLHDKDPIKLSDIETKPGDYYCDVEKDEWYQKVETGEWLKVKTPPEKLMPDFTIVDLSNI